MPRTREVPQHGGLAALDIDGDDDRAVEEKLRPEQGPEGAPPRRLDAEEVDHQDDKRHPAPC